VAQPWGTVGVGPVLVFPIAFALLLQQHFSFAGDPQRSTVNRLTLQPFVTKLLPDSWYVQTQPIVALDFANGTSRVPLNLGVDKLFAGRWNVSLQATAYPRWTSPPSKELRDPTQRRLPPARAVREAVGAGPAGARRGPHEGRLSARSGAAADRRQVRATSFGIDWAGSGDHGSGLETRRPRAGLVVIAAGDAGRAMTT
jgi:hypothetical protein